MLYLPALVILIPESVSRVTPLDKSVVFSGMGAGVTVGIVKSVVS